MQNWLSYRCKETHITRAQSQCLERSYSVNEIVVIAKEKQRKGRRNERQTHQMCTKMVDDEVRIQAIFLRI